MNLLQRVRDILLRPKATWPEIAAEPADAGSLYRDYLLILAAIPALASVVGLSLVGISSFGNLGVDLRVPLGAALVSALIGYVLSLAMVFVVALLVDALAPMFGGSRNRIAALKLVAYASTAAFVGGLFNVQPVLSVLGLLASLYGIYLLYTGLPVLMQCPPGKAPAYAAAVALGGIVASLLVGALGGLLAPTLGMRFGGGTAANDAAVILKTPDAEVRIDAGNMDEEAARRIEEIGKKIEEAATLGGQQQQQQGAATPIDPQQLKALLPETLAGLRRDSIEAQQGGAMGLVAGSQASARYRDGARRIDVQVTDMGGAAGLLGVAGWASVTLDRETEREVEKIYQEGGRTVREEWATDGSRAEFMVVLANGLLVEARGRRIDMAALRARGREPGFGAAGGAAAGGEGWVVRAGRVLSSRGAMPILRGMALASRACPNAPGRICVRNASAEILGLPIWSVVVDAQAGSDSNFDDLI